MNNPSASHAEQQKAIALAGVCQATYLVQQVARTGEVQPEPFACCLQSVLVTDPDEPVQVFGELANLRLGLQALTGQLSNKGDSKDAEVTRYIAAVLGLERKLSRNTKKLAELGQRIEQLQRQSQHFNLTDDQMLGNFANAYIDTISKIGPRIQVAGEPDIIKRPLVQHKIRALLLAAIRAAVLWRQLGGQRRQVLFSRRKALNAAEFLLKTLA